MNSRRRPRGVGQLKSAASFLQFLVHNLKAAAEFVGGQLTKGAPGEFFAPGGQRLVNVRAQRL